jgi:hypothetical protein
MLAIPGHRSGPGAYATWLGKVADFRAGAPSGAQFVAQDGNRDANTTGRD